MGELGCAGANGCQHAKHGRCCAPTYTFCCRGSSHENNSRRRQVYVVNANSNTSGNNAGAGNREMMPSLPSTLMLSSVALPITAPAPGDVMDELFAGLSSYDTGVSGSNSASNTNNALPPQQQQQQPRRQTLDDFF